MNSNHRQYLSGRARWAVIASRKVGRPLWIRKVIPYPRGTAQRKSAALPP